MLFFTFFSKLFVGTKKNNESHLLLLRNNGTCQMSVCISFSFFQTLWVKTNTINEWLALINLDCSSFAKKKISKLYVCVGGQRIYLVFSHTWGTYPGGGKFLFIGFTVPRSAAAILRLRLRSDLEPQVFWQNPTK